MTAPLTCSRACIIDSAGKLLLARRSPLTTLSGLWELPGGKIDAGETDRQAAVREVMEEVGLDITVRDLLHDDLDIWKGEPLRTLIWNASLNGEAQVALNPREHDAYGWFYLHDPPATTEMTSSAVSGLNALAFSSRAA